MARNGGKTKEKGHLKWWQLSLLGVACTIGTGYFLGSGLAITVGGPSVLLSFVLAALGTYIVFDVLAKMTAEHPMKGSFRSYAKKAFGRWAGFSSGWVYWSSELLIMGSQLTALSLFSRLWFPNIPMWIFASAYAVLGLLIIWSGTKGFERLEHLFAVIKISAIVMFLIIAVIALTGVLKVSSHPPTVPRSATAIFPNGAVGVWSSLIYAFYAFGGIEIIGLMATRLRKPSEAPKAGKIMLTMLAGVYVASIALAIILIPLNAFQTKSSPFMITLTHYRLPFVPDIFNGVLIIAGFSTMVASLFAVTSILVTLAEDGDAPPIFAVTTKKNRPLRALGLTACGLIASIVMALLLPGELYEFVTTAAGLMLLYNWFFILVTSGRLLKLTTWGKTKRLIGMGILLLAVSGTLFHRTSRPGFWISLLFIVAIAGVTLIMRMVWKKQDRRTDTRTVHFSPEQHVKRLQPKIKSKTD